MDVQHFRLTVLFWALLLSPGIAFAAPNPQTPPTPQPQPVPFRCPPPYVQPTPNACLEQTMNRYLSTVILVLLAHTAAHAQSSPDFASLDYTASQAGKTLQTSDGVWNFGPQQTTDGGYQILLNGNGSNGGYAKIIQVANDTLYALANDNSWWMWNKTTAWNTSPGTPYDFSCDPVTTYTDGSSVTKQITYTFTRGTSPKDFTTEVRTEPTCHHVFYGLTGTNYVTVTAKDPSGAESPLSSMYFLGLQVKAPAAPANLVVKGNAQVFAVKQSKDHLATTVPVGTVPLNTVCDTTQRVNDMFVVPTSKVTWYGNVRPQAVVASCNVP